MRQRFRIEKKVNSICVLSIIQTFVCATNIRYNQAELYLQRIQMFRQQTNTQIQQDNRQARRIAVFKKFLQDVGVFLPGVSKPLCFISYAWEDDTTDAGKKANAIRLRAYHRAPLSSISIHPIHNVYSASALLSSSSASVAASVTNQGEFYASQQPQSQ